MASVGHDIGFGIGIAHGFATLGTIGFDGHVDLRHSVPDVLASTANLLKTNGWQAGAPFTPGTPNFEVAMREWNHSEVYRKTIVLMAQRISGG